MAQFEVTNHLIGEFSQRERLRAGTAGTERADPEASGMLVLGFLFIILLFNLRPHTVVRRRHPHSE